MTKPEGIYTLRYMHVNDIPRVVSIDRQSFSIPWSARSYVYEVTESTYSHMVVLEHTEPLPSGGLWLNWWQQITGQTPTKTLLAYGGLWYMGTETHISTIASHPRHRGEGWGKLVLIGMLKRSMLMDVSRVVLEVRFSNEVAQTLYSQLGFQIRGVKHGYYHDNNENAYDMMLDLRNQHNRDQIDELYQGYLKRYALQDTYTGI